MLTLVITMKMASDNIRQMESSLGIEGKSLISRKVSKPVRKGWAEAAKKIADAGDDGLVMGEFGNLGDEDPDWYLAAQPK